MELWGVVPILVFGVLYIGIIAGIINEGEKSIFT